MIIKKISSTIMIFLFLEIIFVHSTAAQETTPSQEVTQFCKPYATCGWNNLPAETFEVKLIADSTIAAPFYKMDSTQPFILYQNGILSQTTNNLTARPLPINTTFTVQPKDKFNFKIMVDKETNLTFLTNAKTEIKTANTNNQAYINASNASSIATDRSLPATGGRPTFLGTLKAFLTFVWNH
jgi:hypothetical protein